MKRILNQADFVGIRLKISSSLLTFVNRRRRRSPVNSNGSTFYNSTRDSRLHARLRRANPIGDVREMERILERDNEEVTVDVSV